jgi:hypothetical protein
MSWKCEVDISCSEKISVTDFCASGDDSSDFMTIGQRFPFYLSHYACKQNNMIITKRGGKLHTENGINAVHKYVVTHTHTHIENDSSREFIEYFPNIQGVSYLVG